MPIQRRLIFIVFTLLCSFVYVIDTLYYKFKRQQKSVFIDIESSTKVNLNSTKHIQKTKIGNRKISSDSGLTLNVRPMTQPELQTPLSKQKHNTESISTILKNDTLCDVDGDYAIKDELFENPSERKILIYQGLTAVRKSVQNKCLEAMISSDPDRAYKLTQESDKVECRFLRALFLTNQYEPQGNDKNTDIQKGLDILAELKTEFPDNGIYPFFRIGALANKREFENLEREILDLFQTRHFNNPLLPLSIELKSLGAKNGTAYILSSELVSSHGVPDYMGAFKALKSWLLENPSPQAQMWLNQQVQHIEKVRTLKLRDPQISVIEVATTKRIITTYYEKWHPDQNLPEILSPSQWIPFFNHMTGLNDSISDYLSYPKNCNGDLQYAQKHYKEDLLFLGTEFNL